MNDGLQEFKSRLRNDESAQDFFGDWSKWRGRADFGYFLGCEFVKRLVVRYSLEELLDMPYAAVKRAFDALQSL